MAIVTLPYAFGSFATSYDYQAQEVALATATNQISETLRGIIGEFI